MHKRLRAIGLAVMAVTVMSAGLQGQAGTLTDDDRAQIRQLSVRYLETLGSCAAADYAALFAPGAYFFSTFRGRIEGTDNLIALVTSETHCKNNTPRAASPVPNFEITPTSRDGASARILLGNVGAYEDVYIKTPAGWRFKSRSVLTPAELAARQDGTPSPAPPR